MKSKYWIKLYHEILDDPKMGKLSDRLFRRVIQLFLLAGDNDQDGELPSVEDMAWRLRVDQDEFTADLDELQKTGIVLLNGDRWYVAKFKTRQAAESSNERWHNWKDRQNKQRYYEVPTISQTCQNDKELTYNQRIANDMLTEKSREEKIKRREEEEESAPEATFPYFSDNRIMQVVSKATGIVAIPPKEVERIEQIHSLVNAYGEEAVVKAIEKAFNRWCKAKTKNGRPYSRVNFGWLDWAQDELSGGGEKEKSVSQMTDAEYLEYKLRGAEVPDG